MKRGKEQRKTMGQRKNPFQFTPMQENRRWWVKGQDWKKIRQKPLEIGSDGREILKL
jgi:hypothetical protein